MFRACDMLKRSKARVLWEGPLDPERSVVSLLSLRGFSRPRIAPRECTSPRVQRPLNPRARPSRTGAALALARAPRRCLSPRSQEAQEGSQPSVKDRERLLHVEVAQHAVGAAEPRKHHGVDPLPREGGVAGAVEAAHVGRVERHGEHAEGRDPGDGPVGAVRAVEEAAVRPRRRDLLEDDGVPEARPERLEPLDEGGARALLGLLVLPRRLELPVLDEVGGEGVDDVRAVRREARVEDGGDGDKQRPVGVLEPLPVLEDDVVALAVVREHTGLHPEVHGEERGALPEPLEEAPLRLGHRRLREQLLEGVPARRVADHGPCADDLAVGHPHPDSAAGAALGLLREDLPHAGPVPDAAPPLLDALGEELGEPPDAPLGIVDAAVVAVAEDHPRVDHRCHLRLHRAPAEALHVDVREELLVPDVPPRDAARVGRRHPREEQASEGVPRKLRQQIPRLLEALELERVQRIKHLPALAIEAADALLLVREPADELLHVLLVVAPHHRMEAFRVGLCAREVVMDLCWVRDRLDALPYCLKAFGKEVGLPVVAKTKHHRAPHIEPEPLTLIRSRAAAWDDVFFQHQHLRPRLGQLCCC
mmetsp:Transcript_25918/g.61629  ORF Transcript_25918/g.61629 Transcript_25918/m.61629 type:complete len:592 (-) Transcript_25918:546-2321(-)